MRNRYVPLTLKFFIEIDLLVNILPIKYNNIHSITIFQNKKKIHFGEKK